jgi:hypothetical protein
VRNPNPVLAPEAAHAPAHGPDPGGTTPNRNDDHGKAATAGAGTH